MFVGKGNFEKLLLEIKKDVLSDAKIDQEIRNIKNRPLNSLSKGRDRFLVKIYRRKFFNVIDNKEFKKAGLEDEYKNYIDSLDQEENDSELIQI